jgi:O-antigen/teichoic acid export membrane protein
VTQPNGVSTDDERRPLALVAGNSVWNLIAFLVGIGANLITLPFVIGHLGIFQFGICGLFIALATPLSLVGTTLGQSTAQGIARYLSQDDRVAVTEFCATILVLGSLGIAVTGIVLGSVAPLIVRGLYPKYEAGIHSIRLVSITLAFGWAAQQLSLLMQGTHVACQTYRRIATINALGAIVGALFIFGIVTRQPNVEGYILALALGYGSTTLFWAVSTIATFPWVMVRPRIHRHMTRSIAAFTGWQMFAQLVANLAGQIDRYLLGAWVSAEAVGYYNVSQRLEEVAYIGVLRAGDALFPQFSMNASEALDRQAEIFFRAAWMLNLVAAIVLSPLLPWAPSLLLVWVGPTASEFATPVLRVLTVGGLLGCAGNVFSLYALGIAKTRYIALLSVASALTTTVASIVLLRQFGFAAAGMGVVLGMLANACVMISLIRHHFGRQGSAGRIATSVLLPIAVALVVAGGVAAVGIPIQNSWPRVLLGYAATSLLVMLSIVLVTRLTHEGRKSLADLRSLASLPMAWFADRLKSHVRG